MIHFANAMFILSAGTLILQSTGKFDKSLCESFLFIYNKCSYKYSDCHLEIFGMEVFMDNRLIIYHFCYWQLVTDDIITHSKLWLHNLKYLFYG